MASRVDRRQRNQAQIRRPPFSAVPGTIPVQLRYTALAFCRYRSRAQWGHIVAVVSRVRSLCLQFQGAAEAYTRAQTGLTGTRVHGKES